MSRLNKTKPTDTPKIAAYIKSRGVRDTTTSPELNFPRRVLGSLERKQTKKKKRKKKKK